MNGWLTNVVGGYLFPYVHNVYSVAVVMMSCWKVKSRSVVSAFTIVKHYIERTTYLVLARTWRQFFEFENKVLRKREGSRSNARLVRVVRRRKSIHNIHWLIFSARNHNRKNIKNVINIRKENLNQAKLLS